MYEDIKSVIEERFFTPKKNEAGEEVMPTIDKDQLWKLVEFSIGDKVMKALDDVKQRITNATMEDTTDEHMHSRTAGWNLALQKAIVICSEKQGEIDVVEGV